MKHVFELEPVLIRIVIRFFFRNGFRKTQIPRKVQVFLKVWNMVRTGRFIQKLKTQPLAWLVSGYYEDIVELRDWPSDIIRSDIDQCRSSYPCILHLAFHSALWLCTWSFESLIVCCNEISRVSNRGKEERKGKVVFLRCLQVLSTICASCFSQEVATIFQCV